MEINQASAETAAVLMPFVRRLQVNLGRTNELLKISKEFSSAGSKEKSVVADDLLRAAIVFLHATLEDALRTLSMLYLPQSSESQLNNIPLVGTGVGTRPEKFLLGKLVAHRGKTVDALLEASVAAYLARSNYNDTKEIASLLSGLGMSLKKINKQFPALDELMKRRHQIVHRADMFFEKSETPEKLDEISLSEIEGWIAAVRELTTQMLAHIIGKEMKARLPHLPV